MTLIIIDMIIQRPHYLDKLISCRHNGMIKIITGIRRCGKSFLLFQLFSEWLEQQGISQSHIIKIDLESRRNKALRDPDALLNYIDAQIKDDQMHYVMIDEVQLVPEFEDVLNSYLKIQNVDVYATGSNARFLSKDVITTFRGRSFEIKVYPLSFSEFFSAYQGTEKEAFDEFMTFGGMPQILSFENAELKSEYLKSLYTETYLRDIKDRYQIKNDEDMDNLLDFISSSIGSLTNPSKLANTFETVKKETTPAVKTTPVEESAKVVEAPVVKPKKVEVKEVKTTPVTISAKTVVKPTASVENVAPVQSYQSAVSTAAANNSYGTQWISTNTAPKAASTVLVKVTKTTQVLSAPNGQKLNQQVEAGSAFVVIASKYANGNLYYEISNGKWIMAKYTTQEAQITAKSGVLTINSKPDYGVAVWRVPGQDQISGKFLKDGSSWRYFRVANVNGQTWYDLGGNQWISAKSVLVR